jgi:hypothetical protein
METKFKTGDWCFCDRRLKQIVDMDGDKITDVADGYSRSSYVDFSEICFPLDLDIKRISDDVEYYYNSLHKIKSANLNYPELNREYTRRWVKMCKLRNNEVALKKEWFRFVKFHELIVAEVEIKKNTVIGGVQIFR